MVKLLMRREHGFLTALAREVRVSGNSLHLVADGGTSDANFARK